MPSWTLHLVNARGQLAACAETIRQACAQAEARVAAVTNPMALDIVISAVQGGTGGMRVGGHCYEPGVIGLRIDLAQQADTHSLYAELLKTLFHEFHHALRWEGPGYGDTLGEALVSEGLAQRFVHEIMDCPPEPFENAVPPELFEAFRSEAQSAFDDAGYDHRAWFFGAGEKPNWLGYALGRHMVDRFLQRHAQSTALTLAHMEARQFAFTLNQPF